MNQLWTEPAEKRSDPLLRFLLSWRMIRAQGKPEMAASWISTGDFDRLISRTCRQLVAQQTIPLSPGGMNGDELQLCAGAILVREAVAMFRSQEFAHKFAREAITRDSDYIRKVGASIGLHKPMVDCVIVSNDRLPPSTRLRGVLKHIVRLRSIDCTAGGPNSSSSNGDDAVGP